MKCKTISKFKSIKLKNNSLIFLDIDETIYYYKDITPEWWEKTINYYSSLLTTYDKETVKTLSLKEWAYYVYHHNPIFTDESGFYNLLKQVQETNSKIIFVTAREKCFEYITKKDFSYLNIPYENYDIFHLSGQSKGKKIKEQIFLNIKQFNHFYFIDDMQHNLDDVQLYNKFSNIEYFKFQVKRQN